jgi:hypothetical protein
MGNLGIILKLHCSRAVYRPVNYRCFTDFPNRIVAVDYRRPFSIALLPTCFLPTHYWNESDAEMTPTLGSMNVKNEQWQGVLDFYQE